MRFFLVLLLIAVCSADRQIVSRRTMEQMPPGWEVQGFPEPTDTVVVRFALFQRNLDLLEKMFWDVSTPGRHNYRNFMTTDEILDVVAPPAAEVAKVVSALQNFGVAEIKNFRDALAVRMTVATAEQLFDTKFYTFHHKERDVTIFRQLGTYSLPEELISMVEMVTGVSDFPMIQKKLHQSNSGEVAVPATTNTIYQVPPTASAAGTSQGVGEFGAGQYFGPAELQTFASGNGITIDELTSEHIVGGASSIGVEGTLDIQWIAAAGTGSTNWYWTDKTWLYDFAQNFFAASDVPEIISLSYGWYEGDQCRITPDCSTLGIDSKTYVGRVNTEFQKIGLKGASLLSASGDSGANGRTDPTCTMPDLRPAFPGASPFITSVGATQINDPETSLANPPPICSNHTCISGGNETAVSYQVAHFTSGGGFSIYSAMPDYQKDAVTAYLNSGVDLPPSTMYNQSNRGMPDVAALGNAILIYTKAMGGWGAVGGTSASSPMFAGFASLLNSVAKSKDGKPLGFLNPLLYKMAADCPTCFRDITIGDNICTEYGCAASCKGYKCFKGWDPVTGLGVPNVQAMLNYVKQQL